MKWIIRQFLISFALISVILICNCERKFRLSRVFDNISERKTKTFKNELENDMSRAFDMDCVKNFFNLPQNNKMIVMKIEEIIFTVAAAMKCSNEEKVFEVQLNEHISKGLGKEIDCMKWMLQNLEPESKLLENFKLTENETNNCSEQFSTDGIMIIQFELEQILGPLSIYTCGAVTGGDDYTKFLTKGAIIKFGDISEELKEIEMQKLMEYFKEISLKTVNCNIKRFENDPEGHSIIDNLNYYFHEYMERVDRNKKSKSDYIKKIAKLENTIDHDCVKENLNLAENGNKSLLQIEATILLAAAKSKCIKSDFLEFSELFFNFTIPEHYKSEENVICAKYKLQKLEPTSKLVENVISNGTYEEFCINHDVYIHPFDNYQWDYEKSVGRLNEKSCGVLTNDLVNVIDFKTYLLATEMNEDLKKSEVQELFDVVTDKLQKLAECVLV